MAWSPHTAHLLDFCSPPYSRTLHSCDGGLYMMGGRIRSTRIKPPTFGQSHWLTLPFETYGHWTNELTWSQMNRGEIPGRESNLCLIWALGLKSKHLNLLPRLSLFHVILSRFITCCHLHELVNIFNAMNYGISKNHKYIFKNPRIICICIITL